MNDNRTFKELAASVLEAPDCQVEISDRFVGSTHLFVRNQMQHVRDCIAINEGHGLTTNPSEIPAAIVAKRLLKEVNDEIDAGRVKPVMNDNFNLR